jgi:WD40 repeat protein
VLKAHTGTVRCVHFSADGRTLATASDDKTVKLWSLPAQRFVCTLAGHSNWVRTAQISPDGRLVVSAGDDRCVKVRAALQGWDIRPPQCGFSGCVDAHIGPPLLPPASPVRADGAPAAELPPASLPEASERIDD